MRNAHVRPRAQKKKRRREDRRWENAMSLIIFPKKVIRNARLVFAGRKTAGGTARARSYNFNLKAGKDVSKEKSITPERPYHHGRRHGGKYETNNSRGQGNKPEGGPRGKIRVSLVKTNRKELRGLRTR